MSLGLPPAPSPPRPRMLFIGTAFACAAAAMLFMGMLAVWVNLRDAAGGTTAAWLPKGVSVSMVAPNMMLIIMLGASVMVQWAVYAMARDDRRDTVVAVSLAVVFGIAVLNAQAFIYQQLGLGIGKTKYANLFYAVTGTFVAALIAGIVMAMVVVFRSLGGRYSSKRHEGISALALYWHFLTVAFSAVWYVVYVVK
ncbi:MAG TPA: cytochrome c oxidase subunit 3 [Acidimicrobiales bacterium]|nr:cytochrome c oxidase subunit 3 [Acidimicrobiales bacterium]